MNNPGWIRFAPAALLWAAASASADRPNVLIFYLDDMGWAQPGCYGGTLAPTPHIDALAARGVRFTQGYVSAPVCAPSRAGLMTGRYQQRSGHDANTTARPGTELVLSETTFAQRMKSAGYATAIAGKWHLGAGPEFLPAARGFDVSFGTISNLGEGEAGRQFYRGTERIADPPGSPVTAPMFRDAALGFIEANRSRPWFLYVALNSVHAPIVAGEPFLARFKGLERRKQAYAAMIAEADQTVGDVTARLRALGLGTNTLVFLISDNGGASPLAEMGGLRGRKWELWEGGIRVPWIAAWEGRIPGGRVLDDPVIQLDVLPTALAAAGAEVPAGWQLDGVNLLPLLEGRAEHLAPRPLFWRFGVQYAVRQGDWKLVKAAAGSPAGLFNLAEDPGEQRDLSAQYPERAAAMQQEWERWNAGMQPPRWEDRRWDGAEARREMKQRKQERRGK